MRERNHASLAALAGAVTAAAVTAAAVAVAAARPLPGDTRLPAGGLRDELRAVPQVERRPERHPRVRIQDRAG